MASTKTKESDNPMLDLFVLYLKFRISKLICNKIEPNI